MLKEKNIKWSMQSNTSSLKNRIFKMSLHNDASKMVIQSNTRQETEMSGTLDFQPV